MLVKSLLIVGALMTSGAALSAPASVAMHDEDTPLFDTLGWFDASIPNGRSEWSFTFEEAQAPTDLSFWHIQEPSCRGFNLEEVQVKGDADDSEWEVLAPNVFDGIAHFKAATSYVQIKLTLSNDRLLRSNCRVLIRKANFVVPQVLTLLAKIELPTCIPDNGERDVCSYALTRIDLPTRDLMSISEPDFERFGLVSGAFYRLQGYLQTLDDGTTQFVLQSSTRVM